MASGVEEFKKNSVTVLCNISIFRILLYELSIKLSHGAFSFRQCAGGGAFRVEDEGEMQPDPRSPSGNVALFGVRWNFNLWGNEKCAQIRV